MLVMIGGAEEALYARPGSAQIIIMKRKGYSCATLNTSHTPGVFSFDQHICNIHPHTNMTCTCTHHSHTNNHSDMPTNLRDYTDL